MTTAAVNGRAPETASRRDRPAPLAVSVLDVDPDLAGSLSDEQRAVAVGFALPVATVDKDEDLGALTEASGAFGALILDGLLAQTVNLGEYTTLALIGPGALAPLAPPVTLPLPITDAELYVLSRTRVALLGDRFLLAASRWPRLVAGLHARMLEHAHRLTAQLAISQLPRVEDRLMALMWLLAESWGRVTPTGIRLRLSLSHEALGALIGARRPTVTLALGKLAKRRSLIKQDNEWLILEPPPSTPAGRALQQPHVHLMNGSSSPWKPQLLAPRDAPRREELRLSSHELEQLLLNIEQSRQRAQRLTAQTRTLRDQHQAIVNTIVEHRANGGRRLQHTPADRNGNLDPNRRPR